MPIARLTFILAVSAMLLTACDGGGGNTGGGGGAGGAGGGGGAVGGGGGGSASLYSVPAFESLSVVDVQDVIARAVAEAQAQSAPAVIAVVDRLGNVLAVYSMTGAAMTAAIPSSDSGINHDVQGLDVPASAAAIAKAITGAFLSSGGNAFSSRTASMIVQEHFPRSAATLGLESGPLFGVQFSQLPCSDLSARYAAGNPPGSLIGPKRSPLGLSADPGGFPLYKNGVVVGGVGIMSDGDYSFDPEVLDVDNDADEAIAFAAASGFAAPVAIQADRISVDGTDLRYSDTDLAALLSNPDTAPGFATLGAGVGGLISVISYYDGLSIRAGQVYGTEASGIRAASLGEFNNPDAFILTNGLGAPRYAPRAGTDSADVPVNLSVAEVRALLEEAFVVMSRARAQIRRPLDSRAQVTISVVDTRGAVLGIVRSPDAPIFGIDVSLQKARTVAFFSGASAAPDLLGDPSADVNGFVPAVRSFLDDPTALTGGTAFGARGLANLSRPHFPDGEVGRPSGPMSRPLDEWSVFSTGLQSALIVTNLAQHLGHVTDTPAGAPDTRDRCAFVPDTAAGQNRLQNGTQIFSGAVPIFRGTTLVGAIGASGDGIDQDDMISFLGLYNASVRLGTIKEADPAIRSDQVVVDLTDAMVRLRFVNCPFAPFLDTNEQNVCQGK